MIVTGLVLVKVAEPPFVILVVVPTTPVRVPGVALTVSCPKAALALLKSYVLPPLVQRSVAGTA